MQIQYTPRLACHAYHRCCRHSQLSLSCSTTLWRMRRLVYQLIGWKAGAQPVVSRAFRSLAADMQEAMVALSTLRWPTSDMEALSACASP